MRSKPNYLAIALLYVGTKEIKGMKHSPTIGGWLERLKAWWRDDETPWCGVALAAWMDEAGISYPKHYYRAMSWKEWGVPCGLEYGAVAVLERKGGGHVGIVTGVNKERTHVRLLGGNQGDMVRESWFSVFRVIAYRRPGGVLLAEAPVVPVGELSTSEA